MEKIFYNGKIYSLDSDNNVYEAMMINDDRIVFVSDNNEVLKMKNDETELISLNGDIVYPAFFYLSNNVFKIIESEIKNAKTDKFIVKCEDIDENYENFCNFDIYKNEFLKLQKIYLQLGIRTIIENDINEKSFTFFKKLAEENLLEINIVGYVDIKSSKKVMDDNCSTYRKYKNGFRLSGYSLSIDGLLVNRQAWLNSPYKKSKKFCGYANVFEEELSYLIKTAYQEKKQLLIECNGDKSLDLFLDVLNNVVEKEKIEDTLRPIVKNVSFINKKQIVKIKQLGVSVLFDLNIVLENTKILKYMLGYKRYCRVFPIRQLIENNVKFAFFNTKDIYNCVYFAEKIINNKKIKKIFSKKLELIKFLNNNSSYMIFDNSFKGSLANGKESSFVLFDENNSVKEVYFNGKKIKK